MSLRRLAALAASLLVAGASADNSTYLNPILPGFHPDPSCILVPEWDNTYFCATSSFLVFPGLPIHASRDLQQWKLASNALSRPEQLPDLAIAARSTSGIWAPTMRFHAGVFYLVTTLVFDDLPKTTPAHWDNFVMTSTDPYNSSAWSDPVHFKFHGYDTSPFWDDDGRSYITGSHTFQIRPGIDQAEINLQTGQTGNYTTLWAGTGGMAPEGPHIYKKDGWYYLLIAEGGTGKDHMVTMARSRSVNGPYEGYELNPVLTNANTSEYFQAIGHADIFQDTLGQWWSCALAVRTGPEFLNYPIGRETILTPVTWEEGSWPVFQPVTGTMSGWAFSAISSIEEGEGGLVDADDHITFPPGSRIPPHLVHWRIPRAEKYIVSPPDHPNTLQLVPSVLNLTAYDGRYAGPEGQTFLSRRQTHTLFTYQVDIEYEFNQEEQEVGVTAFLDQAHHFDLSVVNLALTTDSYETETLVPHLRFRGISRYALANLTHIVALPPHWQDQPLTFQIRAENDTHYGFRVAPAADHQGDEYTTMGFASGVDLSWGFTGTLLGVYATTNGRAGGFGAYVGNWTYLGEKQQIAAAAVPEEGG
ncbi:beta-xylosidase [Peziza echinospora]|nr:beta-xylosidase [Peziza echinospora]